ncbi:MAG TPA: ATP-binding protein [Gemmatimonadaceae bacterium]|nr:ATP-binding protein [Gemmatimonadaceae bacterium]
MPRHRLELDGVTIEWDTDQSKVAQAGHDVAMLWVESTLRVLFDAIRELATDAYPQIMSAWGRRTGMTVAAQLRGLDALGAEGPARERLLALYRVGGWGVAEIVALDAETRDVRMRVRSSWEMRVKEASGDGGWCRFLPQHWAGVWSAYFGVDCVAEELECQSRGAEACVYRIYAAPHRDFDADVSAFFTAEARAALERERREVTDAERRAREQEELAAAAADLASALDIGEQLQRVARRARQLSGSDYAAVATVDPDGRTLWRAIDGSISDGWRATSFEPGHGLAGRVVAHDDTVIVTGFPNNPAFPPEEFPAHAAEGMRTAFGVPMRAAGKPFGAITVGWRRDVAADWDTIALVQTLADIAAAAIVQAQLVASLRQRADEVEAANREMARTNDQLEQRNVELDAAASELNAVLEQMADGVIIAGPDGRIVRANPAADRMHGQPVLGPRGRGGEASPDRFDVRRLDGSPYAPEELPLTRALRRDETVTNAEWTVTRPDGTLVRLLGSAAPLRRPDGRTVGAVLVMRDITERERLTEQLRQATSAKERFFAQISHELRTPVNAVLGYTQLLTEGTAGELPPKAMQMLGRVRRSAQHLLELVNDVLDISRLEAGKMTVEPQELDLVTLVRDTLTTVEPLAEAKGLALAVEAPPSLPAYTDARRVRQILLNLLSNAVKFTTEGTVRVELRELRELPDARAELAVADTGVGIAREDQERVFAEFVQVGKPPKSGDTGGTGLGLPISRRLARLLGGDLRVESEEGRGSRFVCTLPLKAKG